MGDQSRQDQEVLDYEPPTIVPPDDVPCHLAISSVMLGGMSLIAMTVGFLAVATTIFWHRIASGAFLMGGLAGAISVLLLLMALLVGERGRVLAAAGLLLCASLSIFIASRAVLNW